MISSVLSGRISLDRADHRGLADAESAHDHDLQPVGG
jgi:hypothetical protein